MKVRNLIAHGYVAIDPVKLHAAAQVLASLAERYAAAVLAWAEKQAALGR